MSAAECPQTVQSDHHYYEKEIDRTLQKTELSWAESESNKSATINEP